VGSDQGEESPCREEERMWERRSFSDGNAYLSIAILGKLFPRGCDPNIYTLTSMIKGFLQSAQKQQFQFIIKHITTNMSIQKPTINKHPKIIFKKAKIYFFDK